MRAAHRVDASSSPSLTAGSRVLYGLGEQIKPGARRAIKAGAGQGAGGEQLVFCRIWGSN